MPPALLPDHLTGARRERRPAVAEAAGRVLDLGGRTFPLGGRTLVMGILNVTPDSFSDGGRYPLPEEAIAAGLRLAGEGADLVDVGGESTRPGADPVDADEEWRRVGPVIQALVAGGVAVSVDTVKAEVARRAVAAGACLVNDISGGTLDEGMFEVVAAGGAGLVVTHLRGTPRTMQQDTSYDDLPGEISRFLGDRAARCVDAGIPRGSILLDPGIGFGKAAGDNLVILRDLGRFASLGYPLLVGASRKSFIGWLTGQEAADRLEGSLAAAVIASLNGAAMVRVHDVAATRRALAVADAIRLLPAASP